MSYELRIRIYGSTINLLIGKIRKAQKEALLTYCKRHDKKLKGVWYFPADEDQEFMSDSFQSDGPWSWSKIENVFQVDGMVFHDKKQIQDFLKGALNRPTIEEIFLNQKIMKYDGSKIRCHYQGGIELPKLTEDEVFVYYGFIDRLAATYKFDTNVAFLHEKNLEFHFTDCGEYGMVLSNLLYEGNVPEKVSRGSTGVHVLELKFM